jgi:hypothetical protein
VVPVNQRDSFQLAVIVDIMDDGILQMQEGDDYIGPDSVDNFRIAPNIVFFDYEGKRHLKINFLGLICKHDEFKSNFLKLMKEVIIVVDSIMKNIV